MENKILWVTETWKGIKALTMIFLFAPHGKQLTSFKNKARYLLRHVKILFLSVPRAGAFPVVQPEWWEQGKWLVHPIPSCPLRELPQRGRISDIVALCFTSPLKVQQYLPCSKQELHSLQGYTWTWNWLTSGTGAECPQRSFSSESILPRSFSMKLLFDLDFFFF